MQHIPANLRGAGVPSLACQVLIAATSAPSMPAAPGRPGDGSWGGAAHPSRDAADPRTTHPAAGGAPSPSSSRPAGTGSGGCSRPRPASQPDRPAAERHQDGVRGQASRAGRGGEGGRRPPDAPRRDGEPSGGRAIARMIPRDGDRAPPVENPAKNSVNWTILPRAGFRLWLKIILAARKIAAGCAGFAVLVQK